ncbi:hypothetical protein QJ854_gp522 [Moumouvirus goulette]|uniref:Uncharacterized protein n=1 Tax=Moumouvirus goulette TaxID=1247379 RepID=M1NMI9_9VIRU|nr:hypothetical protein QJ854_gp522 [Moumouvirus goulette]AGF85260.1 hypothetical protein glt_00451 [Moumouvirus goulette]
MSNINAISYYKIKQIYLDDMNNIYILDNRDILYLYNKNKFFPFIFDFENINKCFMIDKYTYIIYHDKTISIFDKNLLKINLFDNEIIRNNISDVQYYSDDQIVIILEQGQIFVIFDMSNLNEDYQIKTLINPISGNIPYKNIKTVKNLLFAQKNDVVDIFNMSINDISYIKTINLSLHSGIKIVNDLDFLSIMTINNINDLMKNGCCPFINNEIYLNKGYCIYKASNFLVCYYDINVFEQIIKPFTLIISKKNIQTSKYYNGNYVMTIIFEQEDEMELESNNDFYILSYKKNFYQIDEKFEQIIFDEDLINYDNFYVDKDEDTLSIDLNYQEPIIDQLLYVIPNIYRLNFGRIFQFEQINKYGKVISYGDGVTRHVYNNLRQEIDDVLKNKLDNLDDNKAFKLGQLIYFASTDGGEFFNNIHPYYFYLMSNKEDAELLIRKFKSENYELFMKQYEQYSKNPDMLIDLGIDNKNYLEYIFSSDLSDKQIEIYKYIVKGFKYLYKRNSNYKILKKCCVPHLINRLISSGLFEIGLNLYIKNNKVDLKRFNDFKNIFMDLFSKLSQQEKSIFSQNITGSQYYFGDINIIYAYKKQQIIECEVFNENDILQNMGSDTYPIETINMPIVNKKIKPEYQISTCGRELIIYIEPSENNIQKIIDCLIIQDNFLKN